MPLWPWGVTCHRYPEWHIFPVIRFKNSKERMMATDRPIEICFNSFSLIMLWVCLFSNRPACDVHKRGRKTCKCAGGVLELLFDGVCSPRSETPTHILGFFSIKKWLIWLFFWNFCKLGPISVGFFTSKTADVSFLFYLFIYFFFFAILVIWDPLQRIFLTKIEPFLWIFGEKVTHLDSTSLYA